SSWPTPTQATSRPSPRSFAVATEELEEEGLGGETALLGGGLVERLQIDLDLHVLTDEHPIRDGHVPGEPERRAIDRRRGGRAKDLSALRVRCDAEELDLEAHRSGEP